ncbi:hypothetical protein VIAQ111709_05635 [Vibrio aquimaris]|uniref:Uncharacterized protein n=1 Tax=Vibrio aquimaris TaxID=2587862 RepID=A0A5P9CGZ6_9VIBR|nr:hypothetical protein FIV01_03740 [Vibrio aquimaris]
MLISPLYAVLCDDKFWYKCYISDNKTGVHITRLFTEFQDSILSQNQSLQISSKAKIAHLLTLTLATSLYQQ